MLEGVVEPVEGRLRIAWARELPRKIAGAQPMLATAFAEKGFEQTQERAPPFHRLAEIMDGDAIAALAIFDRGTRVGQNVARNGA